MYIHLDRRLHVSQVHVSQLLFTIIHVHKKCNKELSFV